MPAVSSLAWAPKDASFLHQSAFWPFKVIQDRWFWYQSKARVWLPISRSLWLWSYLALFLRYGDLLAKNCLFLLHFCYPSLIRRPCSLCSLWNFVRKLTVRKLVMGLSSSEDWQHDRSWSHFGMIPVCDGRSSVWRSESIMANTALCIASYADAL